KEVGEVVLMISLIRLADCGGGAWREVVRIRGRLVILERLMVGNIIGGHGAVDRGMLGCAYRGAVCVDGTGSESSLEPAPGDALLVEEIAYVEAGQHHRV